MDEISLFFDLQQNQPVLDKINFGVVEAGTTTYKTVFVRNNLPFRLNVDMTLEGENIFLTESIEAIPPKSISQITFKLTPKVTAMKPITGRLSTKLDWIVE